MDVLDKALDAYRRKLFFEQLNAGYAALRADPEARAEHLAERQLWDATRMDGLDRDEHWTEDGRCAERKISSGVFTKPHGAKGLLPPFPLRENGKD